MQEGVRLYPVDTASRKEIGDGRKIVRTLINAARTSQALAEYGRSVTENPFKKMEKDH